ncbi:Signal transduction histidine kinase [Desulfotomaculum arcticum]|uniref:histidine kinase n=1 Tax=Desulfotruncus arcticus DSM 17038 TaxID=1121424 RepID=A0A1I2VYR3_9FIRM|nr:HAMP domain-containing sensor histidine kinase [Desulfotruncus arcticus]SFG94290.1 Signal transduction histidine kinase [Desulfotomaculum arcticum] [Desulfotruncus arcticus DSM 17038]
MQGIKKRLVGSYLLVILLTVLIMDTFLLLGVRQYYYDNVQDILKKQAEVAGSFYGRYLSDKDLAREAGALLEIFSSTTAAQVQIINAPGVVLADSQGAPTAPNPLFADTQRALAGELGQWQGNLPVTGEPAMSVAYPLKSGAQVVGAVRFVTSLTGIHGVVKNIALILIVTGLLVLILATAVSVLLSTTITGPVEKITRVAGEMAAGRFSARAVKKYDDEVGKLADTLNYMAEEIVRYDQLKNQFIASISHELRTPLTSIKGWAVTLRSGGLKNMAELNDGLSIIERESDRLTLLVDELLDFSRLSAGKITLQQDTVYLPELLDSIVKQLNPRARRQGINLLCETPQDLPVVKADSNRLKQVFINLLDNAFKFTPSGGTVRVSARAGDEQIQIRIADTGNGIPQTELPKVKQKFYKGTASAGSGIGLSICDEIVKLHRGQLIIDSAPGQGTEVRVILPL